ncbi:single-stranded DNA-binding protein [candidate division LCP-89 bacterium B3_LCP]|uniref:Single-stranded DNA-binding protein n=1 Tax=candidate division LCP-89 bacterium B3_LCP TaxID=2012998 RepID=A0A532UZN4_UNCL8|nr:MAG: single-stranded DNA-binding protein [candidate division LCP-89 bacterium B3_LCP]
MADLRMPDINSVIIAGNLVKDPTFRHTTTGGVPVANFTIASNRKFRDNSGQWKEDVCIIGVVAWYKLAESCYQNLKKGSAILVEGELQSRTFKTEDGFSRNIVEIKSRRIQFLNKRGFSTERNLVDADQFKDDQKTEVGESVSFADSKTLEPEDSEPDQV